MKKFKLTILALLTLTLLFSTLSVSALDNNVYERATTEQNTAIILLDELSGTPADLKFDFRVAADREAIDIPTSSRKSSNSPFLNSQMPDDPRTIINGTLTAANGEDWHFFKVTKDRIIFMQLKSNNPSYKVTLYIVDYEEGTATPTNFQATATGASVGANGLEAGDYLLVVTSSGTLGDSYSLGINAANPAGILKAYEYTPSLQQGKVLYANDDYYVNGTFVLNSKPGASMAHLRWNRSFYFSYGGNSSSRTHDVDDVRIRDIKGPFTYSSNYASSDNVMLIEVGEGTLYTYYESRRQSVPYESWATNDDPTGRRTPRRLDALDFQYPNTEHYLVYDLHTGKVIDFYSENLNFYYTMAIENATWTELKD